MGEETDRVVGLELGADDYLAKPAYPRELLARIRAVLRPAEPRMVASTVAVAELELDLDARAARRGAEELHLTALEFDLLRARAERAGRVVSRQALWEAAGRGDVHVGEPTVDVHISRLRAKLGGDDRRWLQTVRPGDGARWGRRHAWWGLTRGVHVLGGGLAIGLVGGWWGRAVASGQGSLWGTWRWAWWPSC